jgi:protoporphyrin/coproporphyrin ferrochelatase
MRYQGVSGFRHDQPRRIGVLITNLGTPEAPTTPALRRYLAQFLADPRVVEVPRLIWFFILHGIILRFRPRRSAHAYRSVWTDAGSPLMLHTLAQRDALREALKPQWGEDLVVECAMRYGKPSIAEVVQSMQQQGVRQLLVLPLYPQYAAATTASTFDALAEDFTARRWLPDLRFVSHYHDDPAYIGALAASVEAHWQQHGRPDKIVMSYHGIPQRYFDNGDPYHCECHKTSRLLAERLGLDKSQYLTSFQSRFGREEWIKPYTDETLKALPGQGVRHVQVVCPGFSADCLETIEEIDVENRGYFMAAGGETYHYIPALNAEPAHIQALAGIISRELSGWTRPDNSDEVRSQHQHHAQQGGAPM